VIIHVRLVIIHVRLVIIHVRLVIVHVRLVIVHIRLVIVEPCQLVLIPKHLYTCFLVLVGSRNRGEHGLISRISSVCYSMTTNLT